MITVKTLCLCGKKMKNIAILASGSGSNLQRIIDCIDSGEISNAKVNLVVADRDCYALERAENHQLPNQLIKRGKDFSENFEKFLPENTDLIVLAGFLSILSKEFCEKYKGKIINIHPALLPKFGGKGMWGHHVHEAVIEAQEKESGATVHFVTSGIAHITGGGLIENVPRIIPNGLCAKIDTSKIQIPSIMLELEKRGNIERMEMFATFNMGVGMVIVVDESEAAKVLETLPDAYEIGKITENSEKIILI